MIRSALAGTVVVLVLGAPWLLAGIGSGRLPVVSGVVAWRNLATAALCGLVLLMAVLGLSIRWRSVAAGGGAPLAVLAMVGIVVLAGRGFAGGAGQGPDGGQLRVLSWNTNGGLVDAVTIAQETLVQDADVLVLPQIADPQYLRLQQLLRTGGYAGLRRIGAETAVFARVRYQVADQQAFDANPERQLIVRPDGWGGPTIVAVHLDIPFLPGGNGFWNRQVDQLAVLCSAASAQDVVLVGDLNATIDNLAGTGLAACTDAAVAAGSAGVGTWPSSLPGVLGISIDHVLVHGVHVRSTGFVVLTDQDDSGARHRPVLATLTTSTTPYQ